MTGSRGMAELIAGTPVIPVLVIERADDALGIAEALVSGGLKVLEVTLRTTEALKAVSAIRHSVPEAIVGVGSVIEPEQFSQAADAGARFAVSPGATDALHAAALRANLPWLPGAQTVSDALELRARGYRIAKFFPAHYSGGVNFLRAIAGPVPDMRFCPTGGISAASAPEYLALPNVACVGGSWLTPEALVAERRWDEIQSLARQAVTLAPRRSNGKARAALNA
ncbi:MAG TPA: bifunctional 4-hydroxy-2-oxoglutarate aldolase/2-dehydro-3-deoxy-phosphogluconate aldolase [Steroidobacteraceae bacterium]